MPPPIIDWVATFNRAVNSYKEPFFTLPFSAKNTLLAYVIKKPWSGTCSRAHTQLLWDWPGMLGFPESHTNGLPNPPPFQPLACNTMAGAWTTCYGAGNQKAQVRSVKIFYLPPHSQSSFISPRRLRIKPYPPFQGQCSHNVVPG